MSANLVVAEWQQLMARPITTIELGDVVLGCAIFIGIGFATGFFRAIRNGGTR